MTSTKTSFLLAAGALASVQAAAMEDIGDNSTNIRKEQCYCIVKSGQNDCASSSGSHRCATYSTKNASCDEWILLPAGTCNKIVSGSTEPGR